MLICGLTVHPISGLVLVTSLTASLSIGGGFGGGYNPPPPKCPAFQCKKGEKPVGKLDHQIWSHGCKEGGMSFLNTASFDPNDPLKGLNQGTSVNKCCVDRDICKQTCGMSAMACHENFQKCSKKICKGDSNCEMQAMLSEMLSEPYEDEGQDPSKKYDPEAARCKGYDRGQKEACQCVAKESWQESTNNKLKAFYGKFNPEKLNNDGEIKDLDEVWKKWKGKEAEMFLALATKYKEKAVEIRAKPKPPPYKPPKNEGKAGAADPLFSEDDSRQEKTQEAHLDESEKEGETTAADDISADAATEAFDKKRRELEKKKRKAADDEDYDLALELKEELKDIAKKEAGRLTALKKQAIEDEDYVAAKRYKQRIEKLEL